MAEDKKNTDKTFLERERKDSEEMIEILRKVPENRKREVFGIIRGFALCAEKVG